MIVLLLIALSWASTPAMKIPADLWESGDMDGAIAGWESFIDEGERGSADLHINLGVAYYRKGNLPRAIAHWRQARIVSPRDPDPPHNLAVARAELEGTPGPYDPLPPWLALFTVNELGVLGTLLLLTASIGGWLAWWRRWTGWPWVAVAILGLLFGVGALEGRRQLVHHPGVVVLDDPLGLRPDPDVSAPPTRTLAPGTELAVQREVGSFLLVQTGDGATGFVPAASVAQVGVRLVLPEQP